MVDLGSFYCSLQSINCNNKSHPKIVAFAIFTGIQAGLTILLSIQWRTKNLLSLALQFPKDLDLLYYKGPFSLICILSLYLHFLSPATSMRTFPFFSTIWLPYNHPCFMYILFVQAMGNIQ